MGILCSQTRSKTFLKFLEKNKKMRKRTLTQRRDPIYNPLDKLIALVKGMSR